MERTKQSPRVEELQKKYRPTAKIYVPHEGGEVAFAYPIFKSNGYQDAGKKILQGRLTIPTGDQLASLIYSAYCENMLNEELQIVRDFMESRDFWNFNINAWTGEGVYVIHDEKAEGESYFVDLARLEGMLSSGTTHDKSGVRFSKDGKVRFAPGDSYEPGITKDGTTKKEMVSSNGFAIASFGVEGAEKIAEVTKLFKDDPRIYVIPTDDPGARKNAKLRVSSVGSRRLLEEEYIVSGFDIDSAMPSEVEKKYSIGLMRK